jgi:hypothetical protein
MEDDWWKKTNIVTTGIEQLNDLLFSGFPFGSQVLLNGPPFMGKDAFINSFIVGNLQRGAPIVVVLTDLSPKQVRDELMYMLPSDIEGYEKQGLLRFVDAYSKPIRLRNIEEGSNVVNIEGPGNTKSLSDALRGMDQPYTQFVFRSLSGLVGMFGFEEAIRFLKEITGWAREGGHVAYYDIDGLCHTERELQWMTRLMDEVVEFFEENRKTCIKIKGSRDVQSRGSIEYHFRKSKFELGPFTLEHVDKMK